ncbi:MAG: glutamine--fructose-6-phosphate transaminase (isomerizing) [Proteobacteria bacterium]|nr:glutamine--fructose-6-phosphate transaminase (isomerizing) [Pseudomonadota bacterium]
MCGIIGYVGREDATPVLLDGLKRLEYRGYDSAGIAVVGPQGLAIRRVEGKLARLEAAIAKEPMHGTTGIGHTRWATHGRPSETNAHPHRSGDTVVVHNGIIENFGELKRFLTSEGFKFSSETDTEVICHLIEHYRRKGEGTFEALRHARSRLSGSYSVVVMNVNEPEAIYVAKRGSPLVVGEGEGQNLVASDIPALLPYTKDMIFLEDGDTAVITPAGIRIFDDSGAETRREPQRIPWSPLMAEKGGYKHFMLKEIFEQPNVMQDVLAGRIDRGRGEVVLDEAGPLFDGDSPRFDRIAIVACGTSYHAGMVGKYLIEALAKMPVAIDVASEFRYREPLLDARTLVLPISQSGETADTLAAQRMSREFGTPVLGICNVVGSSIARSADATLYTHAGPEIGVASTKAFTAQLAVLQLFALYLAQRRGTIERGKLARLVEELTHMPRHMQGILAQAEEIRTIAEGLSYSSHVLYIGRGTNYPIALEGALKLKEISYMHAEGFAAGELKHGPIALIDHGVPVVAIACRDGMREKVLSNVEEVRARGASVIALGQADDAELAEKSSHFIAIPKASWQATPMLTALPMQLIAYYAADHKGTDVDQPRNLAKSVTVE